MREVEEMWGCWQKMGPATRAAVPQGQKPQPRSSQHGVLWGECCVGGLFGVGKRHPPTADRYN